MNGTENKRFNVRVYGLFIKNGSVLLSDERINRVEFTKFPGGGLEFGEGTCDCIIREMKEEARADFTVISHFYTTDFFQLSAFHKQFQVISIYYLIDGPELSEDLMSEVKLDFKGDENAQKFRWKSLVELNDDDVTFPIDKKVVSLLKSTFS